MLTKIRIGVPCGIQRVLECVIVHDSGEIIAQKPFGGSMFGAQTTLLDRMSITLLVLLERSSLLSRNIRPVHDKEIAISLISRQDINATMNGRTSFRIDVSF